MWLITGGQGESSCQVSFQHFCRRHNLQKSTIHFCLVCLARVADNSLFRGITLEKRIFSFLGGIILSAKVFVVEGRNINRGNIELERCGNDISRVHSAKGDAIDFVRTTNENEARRQSLQANNSLSTESAGQEDQDGSRCDGCTNTGRLRYELVSKRDVLYR